MLAGMPYALGATSVIFGKHIDKYDGDKAKGIHTLPVIIGERPSRYLNITLMILQYVFVVALIIGGYFTAVMLAVLVALRRFALVFRVYRQPKPAEPPAEYPEEGWPLWFVAFAFLHNRSFGLLFILALLVDAILVRHVL